MLNETGVPGRVQVSGTLAGHVNVVATPVIFKGDMRRLVDVAHPMAEEFERDQAVRPLGRTCRKYFRIVEDGSQDAGVRARALTRLQALPIPFEIDECSGARRRGWSG